MIIKNEQQLIIDLINDLLLAPRSEPNQYQALRRFLERSSLFEDTAIPELLIQHQINAERVSQQGKTDGAKRKLNANLRAKPYLCPTFTQSKYISSCDHCKKTIVIGDPCFIWRVVGEAWRCWHPICLPQKWWKAVSNNKAFQVWTVDTKFDFTKSNLHLRLVK